MRVGVIGGGIQGVGSALELAARGAEVHLFEKRPSCLTQASLQNEGKIHLGFLYAKDPSPLATTRRIMEGAYLFEPIVNKWLGLDLRESLSSDFLYLVHRGSLLTPGEIESHYRAVSSLAREMSALPEADYFGRDAGIPVHRLSQREYEKFADGKFIAAAFRSPEVAIDPEVLAAGLAARIAQDPRISVQGNVRVLRVDPKDDCVRVTSESGGAVQTEAFDHVINASWEDRLVIDETAGIKPPGPWCFRVKYFLRFRGAARVAAPENLPSATIVLGPFGDTVRYANGDLFVAWYPAGRRGITSEIAPPWLLPLEEPEASQVRSATMLGISEIMPALREFSPELVNASEVQGGIIYALGESDVDDPASQLHGRDRVGPRSLGRFHTIDTGRYVLAPLFAVRIAQQIMEGA